MDEAIALGDIRSVIAAEEAYQSSNDGAFGRLSCLEAPTSCGFAAGTTPFIDARTGASTPRSGYKRSFFAGLPKPGVPDTTGIATYAIVAVPTAPNERHR